MKNWIAAGAGFAGLGLAALAFAATGPVLAAAILLATLYLAPGRGRVVGDTPILRPGDVDPRAVRRYRAENPGATITEAIAATRG